MMSNTFKLKFLTVINAIVLLAVGIFFVAHTSLEEEDKPEPRADFRMLYFDSYLKEQLLNYVSGIWQAPSRVLVELQVAAPEKYLRVDGVKYKIISIDSIDGIFGVIKLTARKDTTEVKDRVDLKFQINKISEVSGVITILFDPIAENCKTIYELDKHAPICLRAFYALHSSSLHIEK